MNNFFTSFRMTMFTKLRMSMLVKLIFTISLLSILSFYSCKKENGKNGDLYLRIVENGVKVTSYLDDNPDIPESFEYGQYYKCSIGIYDYTYITENKTVWNGTYTLIPFYGSKGTIFKKGIDGETRYLTLTLSEKANASLSLRN